MNPRAHAQQADACNNHESLFVTLDSEHGEHCKHDDFVLFLPARLAFRHVRGVLVARGQARLSIGSVAGRMQILFSSHGAVYDTVGTRLLWYYDAAHDPERSRRRPRQAMERPMAVVRRTDAQLLHSFASH